MKDLKEISKNIFDFNQSSSIDSDGEDRACSLTPLDSINACKYLLEILLPGRYGSKTQYTEEIIQEKLSKAYTLLESQFSIVLSKEQVIPILENLFDQLPKLREVSAEDIHASFLGDPAARDHSEVLLSYPGLLAITAHRIAHHIYNLGVPYIPRIINEWAHSKTGIDIHPGAKIEAGIFIDHGTGVVIGQTCKIGKNVKIYQGVTLGAKSFELDENGNPVKNVQRHPTVEDDVVIYANATILGGNTVIGKGAVVGGNVFITKSVVAGSKVSL